MIYLLNTPVLTAYGDYRFVGPIDPKDARERLVGGFHSAIGHQESAVFLSALLGLEIPVHRVAITMQPGDTSLVLRLRGRLPEGRSLTADEMAAFPFELGWLERMVVDDAWAGTGPVSDATTENGRAPGHPSGEDLNCSAVAETAEIS